MLISTRTCHGGLFIHSAILGPLKTQRRKDCFMSSLVLLNSEGIVAQKLQFVSPPDGYVVPEGMILSWRTEVRVAPIPIGNCRCLEPIEAYFYFGKARGQVCREQIKHERNEFFDRIIAENFGSRILTITVQGTSAIEVIALRDRIMHLIDLGIRWGVHNNLNPKPKTGFTKLLRRLLGASK